MGPTKQHEGQVPSAYETRALGFIALGVVALGLVFCLPPIPQHPGYHDFADDRTMLGVPNFLNVASNLPFFVVGALGLGLLLRRGAVGPDGPLLGPAERWPWLVFFAGVLLTGFGSSYYHLAPDNGRLIWDRLPMTLAFMGLFASMIGERIGVRAGAWLLGPLVWLGVVSVLSWHLGERRGAGDLRLYGFVVFYPLLTIPLLIWLFPARYTHAGYVFVALGWYLLAKVLEVGSVDQGVYDATRFVSGHTLKHLAAAAGAFWLLLMVKYRRPAAAGGPRTGAGVPNGRTAVGVRLARRILAALWRVACVVAWSLLGTWTALALFYNAPLPSWAATALALAVALLYGSAFRERLFARGRQGTFWRETRRSLAALAVTAAVAVWYFDFVRPNPNEDWIPKHAEMPHVEIAGDKVHVSNVRNFTWHTPTDFTPGYEGHVYDVSAIHSMYFVLSPIFDLEPVAHVWVCFGFSDGQHVAVSVEARGVEGRPFGLFPSMFRQFQLIYVIGDERDVVGLRGVARKAAVRFYPVRATKEAMRAIFLDMMDRAHSLEEHPEFYNLLANNCLNNVTHHVRRLGVQNLPSEVWLVLTGFSDRYAYDYGFLDTNLPFEKAREAYRIDGWMQSTPLDKTFSERLREVLRRQGADKVPDP